MVRSVQNRTTQHHPAVGIIRAQGRKVVWLAEKAGVTHQYASLMLLGKRRATPEFRRVCSEALGLPESVLFHAPTSAATDGDAPEEPTRAA